MMFEISRIRPCLVLLLLAAGSLFAQDPADWRRPFPPFRIIGSVYWVGTYDLSTYLITTPQGHILINSGMADTVPQIKAGVEKLGFRMADVKILTTTQAHGDHVAGLAALKRMTGARLLVMQEDIEVVETGGKADFRWGDDPSTYFEAVKVDQALKDGGRISLGGLDLTTHRHAGHTKGSASFTFEVQEGGKTYKVGIVNMASINPGVRVAGMPKFPGITGAFERTFRDQKKLKIDVFLSSHALQFNLHDKYKPGDAYNPERFVDPKGYREAVERLEAAYRAQLAAERTGK